MAEWPKAAVLKTVGRLRAPWVRILLPPPLIIRNFIWLSRFYLVRIVYNFPI